jgi:integrase/recombinase XerD
MIESLFPRDWRRYVEGSGGALVRDFANWIIEQRYTRYCAKCHVRRFRAMLIESGGAIKAAKPISPEKLARCFAPWEDDPEYRGTNRAAERFFASKDLLISRQKAKPSASIVAAYRSYLVDERGLSLSTVDQHLSTINELVENVCGRSRNLAQLSRENVERFIDHTGSRLSRHSLQHTVAHLRSFLKFCSTRGLVKTQIDAIDAPSAHRGELPPRALGWSIVQKLLSSIDRSTTEGCRDHAILYLMAHYGLRPSEVAALQLDSIQWERRLLRIEMCKTRAIVVMPVDERALRVLRRYLRLRPPGPWKQIFLRVRCPAGPIKAGTIGDIYDNRARRSGLSLHGTSCYCLRHSFAMRLLQQGVGVKAIGDLLGHHSLESTCVYLRLQTTALRDAALPLPRSRRSSEATQ